MSILLDTDIFSAHLTATGLAHRFFQMDLRIGATGLVFDLTVMTHNYRTLSAYSPFWNRLFQKSRVSAGNFWGTDRQPGTFEPTNCETYRTSGQPFRAPRYPPG